MSQFDELLIAPSEELLKRLYKSAAGQAERPGGGVARTRQIAKSLGLTYPQLICALGFNARIQDLSDVLAVLGFESYDALAHERNLPFTSDIYQQRGTCR